MCSARKRYLRQKIETVKSKKDFGRDWLPARWSNCYEGPQIVAEAARVA